MNLGLCADCPLPGAETKLRILGTLIEDRGLSHFIKVK